MSRFAFVVALALGHLLLPVSSAEAGKRCRRPQPCEVCPRYEYATPVIFYRVYCCVQGSFVYKGMFTNLPAAQYVCNMGCMGATCVILASTDMSTGDLSGMPCAGYGCGPTPAGPAPLPPVHASTAVPVR
jgi:hypothetical protein